MKQVKIILVQEVYTDEYANNLIRDSISDWEEVSDEDFHFLKMNLGHIWNKFGMPQDFRPVVICKDDRPVSVRIDSIKEEIERHKRRVEAAEKERERKKQEKLLKKKAKTEAEEKALLDQLKKKYE